MRDEEEELVRVVEDWLGRLVGGVGAGREGVREVRLLYAMSTWS